MSALKPPTGQNLQSRKYISHEIRYIKITHGSLRVKPFNGREKPLRADTQLLQKNAAAIKWKVVPREADNAIQKSPRQILEELLALIKDDAEKGLAIREFQARKLKRQAPNPPAKGSFYGATNSTPDLASAPGSPKEVHRRPKLRKSLSLSGSRMLFHSFLNTLRISTKRRSRSQDSIFDLGYMEQDHQRVSAVVQNAAMTAQQRRHGTTSQARRPSCSPEPPHTRSLSAEPRSQKKQVRRVAKKYFNARDRGSSSTVEDSNFAVSHKSQDCVDRGRKYKLDSSIVAVREIAAFERRIADFIRFKLPSTNL